MKLKILKPIRKLERPETLKRIDGLGHLSPVALYFWTTRESHET